MTTCYVVRRFAALAGSGLLALAIALPVAAASGTEVAYFPIVGDNTRGGLLIDWLSTTRARVVNGIGAVSGTMTRDATQLVITLDSPLSKMEYPGEFDRCGVPIELRKDTRQIVVRDVSGGANHGTSQVVEIGTLEKTGDCDAGLVGSFGALTDAGTTMNRVAMSARPSVRDLVPGTQVAGFSEETWPRDVESNLTADVVKLYAGGTALFESTGHVVPAIFNAEQWLVLALDGSERAYTRLAIDDATGVESWLRAEWSGGQAQRVIADLIVKPTASASFGTVRQASRMWESGLFINSQAPFAIHLYQDGTGERVARDLPTGTESRTPINWAFAGKNIVQTRPLFRTDRGTRSWVPLGDYGAKIHFVMESEIVTRTDGSSGTFLPARINFYVDTGKAVAP